MITLQPFTEADFDQLIAWINNERLFRQWSGAPFTFPLTADQLRHYMEGANAQGRSEVFIYKAVDSRTGAAVGHISIANIDWEQKSGRLSRVLVGSAAERSRGYGQAMVRAVLAVGFEQLGLQRLGLGVYDFNDKALHCYERCGFQHIGTLRHIVRYEDEYWSSVEMSLEAADWRRTQRTAGGRVRAWRRNTARRMLRKQ